MSALFLPLILRLRDVDHLDALGVELAHGVLVVAPVAVGPLVDDAALLQQPLQHQLDLELAGLHVADADGQVLEIDEDGNQRFFGHGMLVRLVVEWMVRLLRPLEYSYHSRFRRAFNRH